MAAKRQDSKKLIADLTALAEELATAMTYWLRPVRHRGGGG
jgi:hypothetical protein